MYGETDVNAIPEPPLISLSGVFPVAVDENNSTFNKPVDKNGMVFDILSLKLCDEESRSGLILMPNVGWDTAIPVFEVVWFKPNEPSRLVCWLWIFSITFIESSAIDNPEVAIVNESALTSPEVYG